MRTRPRFLLVAVALVTLVAVAIIFPLARSASASSPPSFTLNPLLLDDGSSEPEISIDKNGAMGIVSLQWLFNPSRQAYGTHLWTGSFGATPAHQGVVDGALLQPGQSVFGGGDADVDIGSTGRMHITTLVIIVNPAFTHGQLGVSAITCPNPATPGFSIAQCTAQIIDTTQTDRPWITSDGPHVYVSYHDARDSELIHVQRSDDDGFTWHNVGDPVVGQGGTTGDTTFNSVAGNIVADPYTGNVYNIYAAGETSVLKGTTFTPNHIIVSHSSDQGKSWTASVAYTAPAGASLANILPALTVDPTNGALYAVWSDTHGISLASSTDQGVTWSPAVKVSGAPVNTAILPWVAAYGGTVDVVYYGTDAASNMDSNADWHVYFAQSSGGGFTQTEVNPEPNHHGVMCMIGDSCGSGQRNLLDLFKVAIDPQTGKAAIIYTDDTLTQMTSSNPNTYSCYPNQPLPCPLPQIVLAQQS